MIAFGHLITPEYLKSAEVLIKIETLQFGQFGYWPVVPL
jgi:hypothetical protein